MNDERFLKDWLRDTTDSNADANAAADKVVAGLNQTPQRRRWLPWPLARRSKPDDTPPNGGTRFMFSPAKSIAAVALALAIGGTYLVAISPDPEPTDIAGAPVDFEPAEFTGLFVPGDELRMETVETDGGRTLHRGMAWTPSIAQISDERLDGNLTYAIDNDNYDASGHSLATITYRIENAEGAWQGSKVEVEVDMATALESGELPLTTAVVLYGEGAYEGYVAVMEESSGMVRGVIFPAPPPAASSLPPLPTD